MIKKLILSLSIFATLLIAAPNAQAQGTYTCKYDISCKLESNNCEDGYIPTEPDGTTCLNYHEFECPKNQTFTCTKEEDLQPCPDNTCDRDEQCVGLKECQNIIPGESCSGTCELPDTPSTDIDIPPFKANYQNYKDALGIGSPNLNTSSLGSIVSSFLPYVLTLAGLALFVMLILGGFTLLTGMGNQEQQEKGKKQITSALIGFLIIFASYWIAQILQIIFQINILS